MSGPVPDVEAGTAIARNAFSLVIGQATTTALALVLSATLGRSLGANDFGVQPNFALRALKELHIEFTPRARSGA